MNVIEYQYRHLVWNSVQILITHMTGSSPICPLRSHSLVYIENHLFIVGIGQILDKEIEFIYRSDHTYVYNLDMRIFYTNYYIYNLKKSAQFFAYKGDVKFQAFSYKNVVESELFLALFFNEFQTWMQSSVEGVN